MIIQATLAPMARLCMIGANIAGGKTFSQIGNAFR